MRKKLFGSKRRKAVTLFTVAALIVGVSVAIAAWTTTTNNGKGTAKVSSLVAPTVNAAATFSGGIELTPGNTGDVQSLVTNPNGTALLFQTAGDNGVTFDAGPNCAASNFSINPLGASSATPPTVPANAVNLPITFHDLVKLNANAPNSCQGATVALSGANGTSGIVVTWATP